MNNTTYGYIAQALKRKNKKDGVEGPVTFNSGNGVVFQASLASMRHSMWLKRRLSKLIAEGKPGEVVMAAFVDGLRIVTGRGASRRRMSNALAPKRRQVVAAPVVARAHVRESASEGHDDGGGDDPGGGSDGDSDPDASPSFLPLIGGVPSLSSKIGRLAPSRRFGRRVLMPRALPLEVFA